jgi:hypothetical protein
MKAINRLTDRQKESITLAVIIAAGGLLRFWALDFGLPNTVCRPDELTITVRAWHLFKDPNPHFFNYPSLFLYLLLFGYVLYFGFGSVFGLFSSLDHFETYYYQSFPHFILLGRIISATMGTISIYLVYRLAAKSYSKSVGILSALFFGFTYLHVRDSHFGVTDVPLTFMLILAYLFIVGCLIKGDLKTYIGAGLFTGLAASIKYNAILLFIPIFLAHYLRIRSGGEPIRSMILSKKLWLACSAMGLAFFCGSPYILLDSTQFIKDFVFELNHLETGHMLDLGIGWIYHLRFSLRYGIGLPYLIATLCGLAYVIYRHQNIDLLLLSFPVAYYLLIGAGRTVFVRYIIPCLPFLSIFSAVFVYQLIKKFPFRQGILAGCLSLLLLLPSIHSSISYDKIISREDTRVSALKWAAAHIPSNSPILMSKSTLGLSFIINHFTQLYCFNGNNYYKINPYLNNRVDYVVTAEHFLNLYTKISPEMKALLKTGQFKLVKEINPFNQKINDHIPIYDQIDAFYVPYTDYQGVEAPGPLIRFYQRTT